MPTNEHGIDLRSDEPDGPAGLRAVPTTARLAGLKSATRFWLFADQAVSSITNMLPIVISVLLAVPSVEAAIAVIIGAAAIAMAVARNAIVVPGQLWGSKTWSATLGRSVLAAALLSVTLVPLLAWARIPVGLIIVTVLGCAMVVLFETARGIELAVNGGRRIANWDMLWLGFTTLGCSYGVISHSSDTMIYVLAFFAPLYLITPFVWDGLRFRAPWAENGCEPHWKERDVVGLIMNGLIGQSVPLMAFGLNATLGTQVVATWQSSRVAFRPIGIFANILPVVAPRRLLSGGEDQIVSTTLSFTRRVTIIVSLAAGVLAPLGFVLMRYQGQPVRNAAIWTLLSALEFITVVRFSVDQIALFAVGKGRVALNLRLLVLTAQFAGIGLAFAVGRGLLAEILYVGGVTLAVSISLALFRRSEHKGLYRERVV